MELTFAELFFSMAKLFGGLALFIYGMAVMSGALQKTAGNRLRTFLYKLTKNRFSALGIGTGLGAMIHSSATTVMVVGFINAGLVTLNQSIGVILGANLGTTLSMQLLSLNVGKFSFSAIFLGLLISLATQKNAIKQLGLCLFGFGLLFLGMNTMSDAVGPLKDAGFFQVLLRNTNADTAWGMVVGLLISTAFTAVIQSSGATIGILFAMSTAGVFTSFSQVFPLILGAHIGTCATALLGAVGTQINAKRSAVAHLMFNVIGAVIAIALYRFYAWAAPQLSDTLLRQIAHGHTLVQLVNAALFLPFVNQYARFITFITPSRTKEPEKSHLDDELLVTPEKAIVAALMELRRMSAVARDMFQQTMRGFLDLDPERFHYVRKCDDVLDTLKGALTAYLFALAERKLSRRQSIIIQYLVNATNDLERIGDHVENIAVLTTEKIRKKIWFNDENVRDLIELYKISDEILVLIVKSFEPSFYDSPAKLASNILELRNRYIAVSQGIKRKEHAKILEQKSSALNAMFFNRFVVCFDKLVKHSKTIALVEQEPFFFVKKHKLEKTTDKAIAVQTAETPFAYDPGIFDKE